MSQDIVYFSREIAALTEPSFIIEHDGKLYVTVGVLEYDPKASGLSTEQKRGTAQLRKMFDAGRAKAGVEGVRFEGGIGGPLPVQTGPVPGRPPGKG